MTDQHRLAKLYGVKGLPFPVNEESLYWANRIIELHVGYNTRGFTWNDIRAMCERAIGNADTIPNQP